MNERQQKKDELIRSALFIAIGLLVFPFPAFGACADPAGVEAQIVYSSTQNVPMYCNGSHWIPVGMLNPFAGGSGCPTTTMGIQPEGKIFYNADHHVLQYCDGDDWRAVGVAGGGLTGPSDCANIGDLCADGTVFAGYHPLTQEHLFIPATDQERPGSPGTFTMNWKNATGTDDINPGSDNDGEINHANRGGLIGDFQAFQACEDLSFGGRSDWYLPSRVEIYYIWSVRWIIQFGGNITNFQNATYWSSTEADTTGAWGQGFTGGTQDYNTKTGVYRVRCVRR